jgi:hypothetical protein
MKIMVNGVIRDMTQEEIADYQNNTEKPDYKESIISAIREKYSVDDELAILRQRDSKPEEFAEYFDFVEKIKEDIKHEITDEEAEEIINEEMLENGEN